MAESNLKKRKALVLGGISFNTAIRLDRLPVPKSQTLFCERFQESVGGTGVVKALSLSRLGFDVILHGVIGRDLYGSSIRSFLEREDLTFIYDIDPRGTKRHINTTDADGKRIAIFNFYSELPLGTEVDVSKIERFIPQSDYVVLNIIDYCRDLIPLVKQYGKEVWCDIHDYNGRDLYHQDFIRASDYLMMNSSAMPDYRAFMKQLVKQGKKLVICTRGKDGSTALGSGGKWVDIPVISDYRKENTDGAGDNFFAGMLYGHSKGYDLEKSLQIATIVSGLCVSSSEMVYPALGETKVEQEYKRYYEAGQA